MAYIYYSDSWGELWDDELGYDIDKNILLAKN